MGWREFLTEGNRSGRTAMEELKKQLVDQPLHGLWGYLSAVLPLPAFVFSPWPWLTWGSLLIPAVSIGWWELREKKQAADGSHVWWDPIVDDWAFYIGLGLGAVTDIVVLLLVF